MDAPLIAPSARKTRHPRHRHDPRLQPSDLHDDLDDGFTMFIGADAAANLLEIGVVDTSDGPIILHAMPARLKYLR